MSQSQQPDLNRRRFLQQGTFLGVSIAGSSLLSACGSSSSDNSSPQAPLATGNAWKFPQSIASGDPRPDGAVLWTRVVPSSADDVSSSTQGDFSIQLQISSADNSSKLGSNSALTGALALSDTLIIQQQFDHSARQKITGLQPNTVYYYQFVAGSVRSNVGRFKTAPAATATPTQLDFAVLTCQDWSVNHWAVYSDVANENLDFYVHLGDYIYETVGADFQTGSVESRHGALTLPNGASLGEGTGKYANTLADYRYLYKKYRTDSRLQAVHERFAMVAIWDDHEFSDDCWQASETYSNANQAQGMRRRQANQAWYEFMPADIVYDGSASSTFNNVKLYRDLQFGTLAHLVMTDERLYRSDHMIPEATINPATGVAVGSIGSRYMVPEALLAGAEGQKMQFAIDQGLDPLSYVSILGAEQRQWWKSKMSQSSSQWKLWGNEVSLLKMGVDGSNAIATLVALQAISTVASQISNALAATGGNAVVAGSIVAAVVAGAAQNTAAQAAQAMAIADATGGNLATAASGAGLNATQTGLAVAVFNNSKAAAAGGVEAQVRTAAQTIAFGYIKPDILANKQNSAFVVAAGLQTALAPFFTRFVLNADQWDGYNGERKALMKHLKDNNIKNVVALTGDIHAFFAGQVMDDYNSASPSPVMVDLVTAGASSDSFFTYLRKEVGNLSESLATLIVYPLTIPVSSSLSIDISVNLLNYTMGAASPTIDSLVAGFAVNIRTALAAKGLPEAQLDPTVIGVLNALKSNAAINGQLLPLAQQLAALNSNPWLKHVNTDAQGYSRMTLTRAGLHCEFRQVNKLVGNNAPSNIVAKRVAFSVAANSTQVVPDGLVLTGITVGEPNGTGFVDIKTDDNTPTNPADNCFGDLVFC